MELNIFYHYFFFCFLAFQIEPSQQVAATPAKLNGGSGTCCAKGVRVLEAFVSGKEIEFHQWQGYFPDISLQGFIKVLPIQKE